MKFAEPFWLLGALLALVVAGLYVLGGLGILKATRRFGDPGLVGGLFTARAGGRRAFKGGLVVVAVALAFIALAGPQYGRGTRLIPATNLDCVIALDYSKSMFARDVAPSRTERAKAEVAELIQELPGARFGAVAFAGEPLSFPLTSDGAAIAQFFRQTTPNDMPVGGTAIARALEAARELLERDPLSQKHQRVIVLVTDGEDLEGDPVAVAKAAAKDNTVVHVVQIGSRAPETIPEVDELGQVKGIRRDAQGKPLTTTLTAEGERQLTEVAQAGGGQIVRPETGQTGITEITRALKRMMTEELAERVETVYADIFYYPLGAALLLLLIEVFIPLTGKRKATALRTLATGSLLLFVCGCHDQEQKLFSRFSPDVDRAVRAIKGRDAGTAEGALTEYLSTGRCKDGNIGTPDQIRELPNASVDLGLVLFQLAERYGAKFGDNPPPSEDKAQSALLVKRSSRVDCALRLVRVIAADKRVPIEQRAQAYYLSGNLEFLRYDYRAAVSSYDQALELFPGGSGDAGSVLGTNAAFNRAIALQRAEEEEKNKKKPPQPDGGTPPKDQDGGVPDQDKKDQDQKDQDKKDQDQKDQDKKDQKDQDGQEQPKPEPSSQNQADNSQSDQDKQDGDKQKQPAPGPSAEPASSANAAPANTGKPPSLSQDDRILDELERAPMFQHVEGQQRGRSRINMEDK
ncbi:MAG TPA: VWA domain-containing protein [Polyangiaceae bacterium]|nr:VWA domain-containing protein [Polyangiaceae bacterium]